MWDVWSFTPEKPRKFNTCRIRFGGEILRRAVPHEPQQPPRPVHVGRALVRIQRGEHMPLMAQHDRSLCSRKVVRSRAWPPLRELPHEAALDGEQRVDELAAPGLVRAAGPPDHRLARGQGSERVAVQQEDQSHVLDAVPGRAAMAAEQLPRRPAQGCGMGRPALEESLGIQDQPASPALGVDRQIHRLPVRQPASRPALESFHRLTARQAALLVRIQRGEWFARALDDELLAAQRNPVEQVTDPLADLRVDTLSGMILIRCGHASAQIHSSLAAHATTPQLQPYQGANWVNLLNASVH
jgi:hypothetical protein